MNGFSLSIGISIALSALAQIAGASILPMTRGLNQVTVTVICALCFLTGLGIMSRLIYSGVNLTFVVPLMSALVPMGCVLVATLLYTEPVSIAKISILILACVLIGIANML